MYSGGLPAAADHPLVAAKHVLHAAPTPGGTGISAEYFSDAGLTQPLMTRTDPTISFAGAKGTAAALKSAGSAQWTGSIAAPASGTYTFSVQSNGAVTLAVNGKQLISTSGGSARSNTPIALVAGQQYSFQMTYQKAAGAVPSLKLFWGSAKAKQQVVPQTSLFPAAVAPTLGAVTSGLIGQYFIGDNFQQLAMTRVDSSINFNFGTASPDASIPAHSPFTIQWTGQFTPTTTDNYKFTATADDGVRVYLDGQLVVNDYTLHSVETASGSIVLNAGQAYALKVQYFNSTKLGSIKLTYATSTGTPQPLAASVLSSTPPAAAGVLAVTDAEATEVDLAWTGSPAATGYTVTQSVDGGQTWQPAGTAPAGATTFADTGLTADTAYEFQVTPFGSTDTSTPSNVATATTLVPAPGSVTATVDDTTDLDLSWADVPGETGFDVLQSTAGGPYLPVASTAAGVLNYHVAGLLPGTGYGFEVAALNAAAQPSDASDPATATTPSTAPAGLVAAGTSTTAAQLSWLDTASNGGFVVERSTDGTTWATAGTVPADTVAFTDTNLSPGTTYDYRVRSLAAADPTVVSGPGNVATAYTVTAAPGNVSATPYSDTQVNLTWADVTGEAGFTVLASADGGNTFAPVGTTAAGTTAFSVTPLVPGAAYGFEVEAVSAAGLPSAPSSPAAATTPTLPPALLTALGTGATTAQLTWTPVPAATGYQLERSADSGATWSVVTRTAAATLTYADAGLAAGATYSYRVRAIDAGGASDPSLVAVALTIPAVPTVSLAGLNVATSSVSFPAVAGAASYVVQRSADGVSGWTPVSTVTAAGVATPATGPATLAATVPNLAPSTVYYYRAVASNATGSSAPSAAVGQMTAPLPSLVTDTAILGGTAASQLYSLNMLQGTSSLVGQLLPGAYAVNRRPTTGIVYYFVGNSAAPTVYQWDPSTGNNQAIGSLPYAAQPNRRAYDADGTPWITDTAGDLYSVNTLTGAVTNVGQMKAAGVPLTAGAGNMAFSPTGNLYLINAGTLYMVNTATAALTPLGALGANATNFVFGQSALMYFTSPQGQEFTFNPTTLVETVLSSPLVPAFTSLTAEPTFTDLSVTAAASPAAFAHGHAGSYAVNVANNGPSASTGGFTVTVDLAVNTTFASVAGTGWTAAVTTAASGTAGQTVMLTYTGDLARQGNAPTATVNVSVGASASAAAVSTFTVTAGQFDSGVASNTAAVTTPVS